MYSIVHVSPAYFGEKGYWGGGERTPVELGRAMATVTPTRLVSFGAVRERFTIGALSVDLVPARFRYRGSLFDSVSEKLVKLLAGARLVHVHQYDSLVTVQAVAIARLLRIPVCVTDHGAWGGASILLRWLHLDRRINALLAVSQFSADFFPEFGARREIIYSGFDDARFYVDDTPRRAEVVFVGRVMPHKGVDVLIEAMPADVPLRIFGHTYDSAYRRRLGELARGKDVTFRDDASDADIVKAYRRARVAVLPSVHESADGSRHVKPELFGLTLVEAMACGTPVICSDAGAMPEIVENGHSGWVVPQNDPVALRRRIEQLLVDEEMWRTMSEAAAGRARATFTWRHVADRCLQAYRKFARLG